MAKPTQTSTQQQLDESLRGIENLKPTEELRSLKGIENLKPSVVTPAPEQPATSGAAQSQTPAAPAQSDKPK